ncbi:MAG: hypothetical protein JXQ27_04160 [Acidobacteria bacterium]|nr:hypothetical protein [Acidobacteriota bacterium]
MRLLIMACGIIVLVTGLGGGSADAQYRDFLGGSWNNPGSALITNQLLGRLALKRAARRAAERDETPAETPAPVTPVDRTFRPVADSLMVRPFAEAFAADEETRGELQVVFSQLLAAFDEQCRQEGARYDLARAAALFVAGNYSVARAEEVTEAQTDALIQDMRDNLSLSDTFRMMDDAGRQRLYEALIIMGLFPPVGYQDGVEKNEPSQQEMFRELARENLKTLFGVAPEQIRITDAGMEIGE